MWLLHESHDKRHEESLLSWHVHVNLLQMPHHWDWLSIFTPSSRDKFTVKELQRLQGVLLGQVTCPGEEYTEALRAVAEIVIWYDDGVVYTRLSSIVYTDVSAVAGVINMMAFLWSISYLKTCWDTFQQSLRNILKI